MTKQIKLKLIVNFLDDGFIGGAVSLLNDIKQTTLTLTKNTDGFSLQGNCLDKFIIFSENVQKLNELKKAYIQSMEHVQIGRLSIEFLNIDDSIYNIPDDAVIENNIVEIIFQEPPVPKYIEMDVYQQYAYMHGGVTRTNMPSGSDYVYSKDGDTDPSGWSSDNYYYWDFSKRYEFGRYENDEWIPYIQSLAYMPVNSTSDIKQSVVIRMPSGANLMYHGMSYNSSGGSVSIHNFTCRVYEDTISVWQNADHTDQYPDTRGIITDIPYNPDKTYKILYMLNASGLPVNFTDLYKFVFSNSDGFLKIGLSGGTSDKFAKFVFYEEDV